MIKLWTGSNHTDVAVNKCQQNAQMWELMEAFVSLFIGQHKLSVTPGEKVAAVLQITIIPKAVIKPHWSVDPRDWLESLQTSRQEQDNYQLRINSAAAEAEGCLAVYKDKQNEKNKKAAGDVTYTICARLRGFSGISGNMGWRGSLLDAQLSDLLRAWDNFLAGDFWGETQCWGQFVWTQILFQNTHHCFHEKKKTVPASHHSASHREKKDRCSHWSSADTPLPASPSRLPTLSFFLTHDVYSFIWCWLLWEPLACPLQKQSWQSW